MNGSERANQVEPHRSRDYVARRRMHEGDPHSETRQIKGSRKSAKDYGPMSMAIQM
eukprot:CAMPEP_0182841944 /NCGR_PEP_ID=MMETSP0006_2-20121128/25337_1 /TAXON_ID=97485 /ORGANISM="Prymnesium parvum, Strain Texoma1" /LENGTH=55 /DNA_ID=CAMNT_0024971529 /DNA_START=135 /DNA_END=302 /DNA_ORIENTATION=-